MHHAHATGSETFRLHKIKSKGSSLPSNNNFLTLFISFGFQANTIATLVMWTGRNIRVIVA